MLCQMCIRDRFNNDVDVTLHGGDWSDGVSCGSRAVYCANYLWNVHSAVGCRLACDLSLIHI